MAIDAITGRVFAPVFKDQQTAEVVSPDHPLYERSEAGLMAWRSSDPNAPEGGMPPLHPEYLASHVGSGPGGVPGRPDPRTGEWMEDWSQVVSFWSDDEALMARRPVGIPTSIIPGGDPGDGGLVGTDVRAKMKDDFYLALRGAGMGKKLIEDLWDWVERQLAEDPSFSAERALLGMYDSEAFRTRFPAIANMTDAGVGRRDIPTPGEYIGFEKDVANALSRVGVIKAGESFDNLITQLYENSVGLEEVNQRLNVAQRVMYEMPKAVRDKFDEWFGADSGSITMQTFLDPTDDWSQLQDQISTAQTGGWGQMIAGLDAGWDVDVAKQVSDLGLSQGEQWNRFARLKEQEMLFLETLDERTDLVYEDEGVRAAFSLEAEEEGGLSGYELSDLLSRRGQRRSARFGGGGGAMMLGTRTGFGAANA
jgi:hypothetical protein